MKYEIRKDFNRYLGAFVELEDCRVILTPPQIAAVQRSRIHSCGCWCLECFNQGVRTGDYLKNRALWNDGGAL